MEPSERDTLIRSLALLLESLGVPVSIGLLKGKAASSWTDVHRGTIGFGWATADQYETALRDRLELGPREQPDPASQECPSHPGKFGDH